VHIVTLKEWGFPGWIGSDGEPTEPAIVSMSSRTRIVLHYTGGSHCTRTGPGFPREIDRWHRARGWWGIGYNYLVDQAGQVHEGRGLYRVGAHAEGYNVESWGILIGVGGDQRPSAAALTSTLELVQWLRQRRGRTIPVVGHRDVGETLCPGEHIYAWIERGLEVDDVDLDDRLPIHGYAKAALEAAGWDGEIPDAVLLRQAIEWGFTAAMAALAEIRALAARPALDIDALAARLARETDIDTIKAALSDVLPSIRMVTEDDQ
jgi:hypothetical protein